MSIGVWWAGKIGTCSSVAGKADVKKFNAVSAMPTGGVTTVYGDG